MTRVQSGLRKEVRASQFFTLSFGAIVGVGWIVVLGGWLGHAGPFGAALAFVAGGLVMILIGLCYAEMAALLPVSGGEVAYAFEVFGLRTAYAVGWALALMNTAAVAYVCISMAWILDVLIPGIQGPPLYTFRGEVVHAGSTLVALLGTTMLTYMNYRGVRTAASFQDIFTYGKIGIAVIFIAAGFLGGSTANLRPLFNADASGAIWPGMLAVFIQTPWWLGGFNTVPQVMEEKSPNTSLRTVARVMVLSIFMAALFYAIVILSASMAVPWQRLIHADLPAATAFREAFRSQTIARLVLLAGLLGIVTVGNATCLAASRVLFALSRASIIPPLFSLVHPRFGSPGRAVLFVGAIASFGVLLGRAGILPVVSIGATCLALGYVITALGVVRLRRVDPSRARPYRVPGGAATAAVASAAALFLFGMSVYQPYADAKGALPLEWIVILAWSALGLALWVFAARLRASFSTQERRDIIIGAHEPEAIEPMLQPS
jgi:APA family basic amino acid/polyamine antiporter